MGDVDRPVVSAVIPTYERPGCLKRAVASVAEQTYDPLEVVVVDDCSDVPVTEYLDPDRSAFDRFEVVRHDENRGGSAARNTGIEVADGQYVALLDDDDRWKPEKIARQVERLRRGDVGAVFTGGRIVDGEGNTKRVSEAPATPPTGSTLTKRLLCRNVVGSCSVFMADTDVIEATGTFDERFSSWQDQEWYVRLSRNCNFGSVADPLVVYSEGSADRISDDVETMKNDTYPLFVEKFEPMAAEYGRLFRRKMLAWAAYRVGRALAVNDRILEARSYLARALRLYPFEREFYRYSIPSVGGRRTYELARKVRRIGSYFQ
jgi:glycosyltransferase involved in cell wall biosynthesis